MPITITLKQLALAVQSGALSRYFALDRPLQVAWKNRKQVSASETEYKLYQEKLQALCDKYGVKNAQNPNVYDFDVGDESVKPGEQGPKRKQFEAERQELDKQVIDDMPGEPVKVSEASGSLKTFDCEILEGTFLVD